jgi:hypothetical protein
MYVQDDAHLVLAPDGRWATDQLADAVRSRLDVGDLEHWDVLTLVLAALRPGSVADGDVAAAAASLLHALPFDAAALAA